MTASGRREQMEYLDSDKAGTNGAPRPRTGRNICEVCERALARTDTGMCDFCTVKQQRQAGGVAEPRAAPRRSARSVHLHGSTIFRPPGVHAA
jgi:hypothetical protein